MKMKSQRLQLSRAKAKIKEDQITIGEQKVTLDKSLQKITPQEKELKKKENTLSNVMWRNNFKELRDKVSKTRSIMPKTNKQLLDWSTTSMYHSRNEIALTSEVP